MRNAILRNHLKRFEQLCQGELSFSFAKVYCDTRQQGFSVRFAQIGTAPSEKHRFELLGNFQCEKILENKEISKIYQIFASVLLLRSVMCKPTVASEFRVHFHSFHLGTRSFQKRLREAIGYLRTFSCFTLLKSQKGKFLRNFLLDNGFFKCSVAFQRLNKKYRNFGSFDL